MEETKKRAAKANTDTIESCLRNERIIVRYIKKTSGLWANTTNPRHVLYGGMAESAFRIFTVPKLASTNTYVNVLTNKEKEFLEEYLNLEVGALSIYKKKDNFWDDSNPSGINRVILNKGDNYLDLSNPDDYIKYKILLANKNTIAPSLKALEDRPKETYQFVIIDESAESQKAVTGVSTVMQCYKEFGKIEDNNNIMRVIIEQLSAMSVSQDTKSEFLKVKINELIQRNPRKFLAVITDEYLRVKTLIRQATELGLIYVKGNYYYLKEGNAPMCQENLEPTFENAARWLSLAKNQQIKLMLEAAISGK